MANSRQKLSDQDSLSPKAARTREWDGPSRWTDYLGTEMTSPLLSSSARNFFDDGQSQGNTPSKSHKGLNMQWVVQLTEVADGLMAKMYRLNQLLDYPDPINHVFSEGFWKAGVFPNCPRICMLLSKKFPDHFSKLQLGRIDKIAWDSMQGHAEHHLQSLEPWVQLLLDLMVFREQALLLILDLSSTVITLLVSLSIVALLQCALLCCTKDLETGLYV